MSRYKKEIVKHLSALMQEGPIEENKNYIQHGDVTVFDHCIAVAEYSCRMAEFLHLSVNRKAMIRGALLHDYFLYDWHFKDLKNPHKLHGFYHPSRALHNAQKEYTLTKRQEDIIKKHMWPLTVVPPMCREAWIVTAADKYCSFMETVHLHKGKIKIRKGILKIQSI